MREIKFKYWNTIINQMVENPVMPYKKEWTIEQLFSDRGWIWLQYTGVQDKNGVEIYEGDIVKTRLGSPVVIEYINSYFAVSDQKGWSVGLHLLKPDEEWEVIGNLYQNPELLK